MTTIAACWRSQLAVVAFRAERLTHLDVAERNLLHEQAPERVGIERLTGDARAFGGVGREDLEEPIAYLFGVTLPERRVLGGADVVPVPDNPHDFVVADERVHLPAGARRLALELPEQIQHAP